MTDEMQTMTIAEKLAALPRIHNSRRRAPLPRNPGASPEAQAEAAPKPHVEVLNESGTLGEAVRILGLAVHDLEVHERMDHGLYPGRSAEWYAGVGEYTEAAPLSYDESYSEQMRRLVTEARAVERSKAELESLMLHAVAVNPERDAVHAQEIRMRDEAIRDLQRELTALRRATAVIGETATAGFWRRTGRAIEQDVESILDVIDEPTRLRATAVKLSETLSEFGGHCFVFSETLS